MDESAMAEDKLHKRLEYREFQEYQVSNFQYPYLAYNDLSRLIRVLFLDRSRPDLLVELPPNLHSWSNIQLLRISTIHPQLYFLVEDATDIFLFQYCLREHKYSDSDKPLLSLKKSLLSEGCMIADFWVNSVETTPTIRKIIGG